MSRGRRWRVVVVTVVLMAGCGSGGPDVDAAASRVDDRLRTAFPADYAGLTVEGDRILVYRKPGDRFADAAAREAAGGVPVELRPARFSLGDLRPVVERVDADRPYWRSRGIAIESVWPSYDGDGVDVVVHRSVLDAARAAFADRYPAEPVTVLATPQRGVVPAVIPGATPVQNRADQGRARRSRTKARGTKIEPRA